MVTIRHGKPLTHRRQAHARGSRGGPLVVLFVLAVSTGCAQSRWNWRETFAMAPQAGEDQQISTASVAGRMSQIDRILAQASSLELLEASRYAERFERELATEPTMHVRVAMVRCLGQLPTPKAIDALSVALRDAEAEVRAEACRSLTQIDSSRAMVLLAEVVAQERDVDARLAAVRGLGKFRDPRAVHALGAALEDRDPAVQYVAMQSLERATGRKLGPDVRLWKELTEDPSTVLAERDRGATR
jgi:HEAT repeat protein